NHPRVFVAGKRRYEEIPAFIEAFDVALIPYRLNEVTRAVYPVKLHEYLILGKPVVSTDLPEVRQFSDVVFIAGSKEEFVSNVLIALKNNDQRKKRDRINVAKNNSWEKRIREISKCIQPYLK
ncbi:MAG: glycosyltransferase, partial [Candidatus Hodarchaeota archaeon]